MIQQKDRPAWPVRCIRLALRCVSRLKCPTLQRQFRSTLDQALDSVFLYRPDTLQLYYANRGAVEQVGYSIDELKRMNILDLKVEYSEEEFRELVRPLVTGEQTALRFETTHLRKDGRLVPVEVSLQHMAPRNELPRFISVVRDITDRRRTEQALQEQKALLDNIIATAPYGLFWKDCHCAYLGCNPGYAELVGLKRPKDIIGKTDSDLIHEADELQQIQVCEQKILTRGESFLDQEEFLTRDGETRWINTSRVPLHNAAGENAGIVGVCTDVTEGKLAEQELRRSHQQINKLSLVASKIRHAVMICDEHRRIEWVNEAFTRLSGYALEEVAGRTPREVLVGPETDPATIAEIDAKLERGESVTTEMIHHGKDRKYWVEVSVDPVFDEQGELVNFIATHVDITDRKESQRILQAAKEEAEQASQSKSEFLASMSHELRTPLNGVLGMTELLAETKLNAGQRRLVHACQMSGRSLLTLINDVLDFSKIEAGMVELDEHCFDLLELLEEVMEMMAPRVRGKNVELVYSIDHEAPLVLSGDSGRLRQVLINLIGNAIKFTERGEVDIRVELREISDERATLEFVVRDTGIGIPADRLDLLFRSFTQVDSSTSRKYGGTGLGLSISKSLVEAMGGSIGVESTLGVGSRFEFTADFKRLASKLPKSIGSYAELKQLRVLVVEDNDACRNSLTDAFEGWGMNVRGAVAANEALDSLRTAEQADRPFHLIVIDSTLPDVSGRQLAKLIRREKQFQELKIFLIEPIHDGTARLRRGNGDIQAFLRKPLRQSQLLDAITDAFCPQEKRAETVDKRSKPDRAQPVTVRPNAQILLAEDNITNQLFTREILARAGLHCDIVGNGQEAVAEVTRKRYDLVLMDCQMPEMDGFEATREIRNRESDGRLRGQLPIVALTANAIKGDRERCLEAGMDDYIAKPFNSAQLIGVVQQLLSPGYQSQTSEPSEADMSSQESGADPPIRTEELMTRCMGDLQFAETLLESFERDSKVRLEGLLSHLSRRDAHAASEVAHALKGMASIVAARRVQNLAADVETAGQAGQLEEMQDLVEVLRDEIDCCLEYLPTVRQQTEQLVTPESEKGGP